MAEAGAPDVAGAAGQQYSHGRPSDQMKTTLVSSRPASSSPPTPRKSTPLPPPRSSQASPPRSLDPPGEVVDGQRAEPVDALPDCKAVIGAEVDDGLHAEGAAHLEGVGACAADQHVVAGAADQPVVAVAAVEIVVAAAAVQPVVAALAPDRVVAAAEVVARRHTSLPSPRWMMSSPPPPSTRSSPVPASIRSSP